MNIVFTPTAWEQYTEWQREDDYRSVQETTSSQQYEYHPVYDYNRFPSHDDCKADHYDDDDNSLKGYE